MSDYYFGDERRKKRKWRRALLLVLLLSAGAWWFLSQENQTISDDGMLEIDRPFTIKQDAKNLSSQPKPSTQVIKSNTQASPSVVKTPPVQDIAPAELDALN